jgi:hypothetical protein
MSSLTMGLMTKMINVTFGHNVQKLSFIKNETEGDRINEGNYLRQCTSWQY